MRIFSIIDPERNRQLKLLSICVVSAFFIWFIPFVLRMSIDDSKHETKIDKTNNSTNVLTDVFKAHSAGNHSKVFVLILSNNLKVAMINILGGVLIGIGTLGSLAHNGFFAADMFCSVHKRGMSWSRIIEYTAPHSLEMIGIWLSGGLGFYIAITIINMMLKNKQPKLIDLKIIIGSVIAVVLIISLSAYIEAFVSMV